MTRINRALEDPMMDDIDHALGRPKSAFGGYRNHYAASRGSIEHERMAASPYWQRWDSLDRGGSLVTYRVTRAGREALHEYLTRLEGSRK